MEFIALGTFYCAVILSGVRRFGEIRHIKGFILEMLVQVLKVEIGTEMHFTMIIYFSKSINFPYSCYLHEKSFVHNILCCLHPTLYLLNFNSE
jgi:hypothetical protein